MGNRFHPDRRDHSRRSDLVSTSRKGVPSGRDAFLSALFESPDGRRQKPDYKTQMLCRQVQRALLLAFGGEINGVDLTDLSVGEVHPAPNAGHLVIEVIVSPSASESPSALMGRLEAVTPRLRHLLAQSISRNRVPELSFVPVAGGGA